MNFIVLSSSKGTVFQSVIDRIADGSLHAHCLGLITDRADRGCVEKADKAGVPVKIIPMMQGGDREAYDKKIHQTACTLFGIEPKTTYQIPDTENVIACMGWMYLFSPWFVKQWRGRILNVHPALLPKYPGTHAHEEVLANKDTESGMSIHLIDEGIDTGKILLQKKCPVLPDDTKETLKARVQALECEWSPKVLEMIEKGEMSMWESGKM